MKIIIKTKEKKQENSTFHIETPTEGLSYKNTNNTDWVRKKLISNQPLFTIGHAGWGKTQIIKQVALSHGLNVISIYLDKALPEDLGGIPIIDIDERGVKHIKNTLPQWAKYIIDNPTEDFLVFFDELNQAKYDVQNALMPILLEKTVCGLKLNNVLFAAAGNYVHENAAVIQFSEPLMSRFIKEYTWEENWFNAFEYIIEKFKDVMDEDVIKNLIKHNICQNPREFESMLNSIIDFKEADENTNHEMLYNFYKAYDKGDLSAELKETVKIITNFLNKNINKIKTQTHSRGLLKKSDIEYIKQAVKSGKFIDADLKCHTVTKDNVMEIFNLSAEEFNIIFNK